MSAPLSKDALSQSGMAPPVLPPARILVVDDVDANVLVLSKMVKVLGHQPFSAGDGLKAIEKAHAEKPDLILMDVMMPVMDGIEATRRLKADPTTRLIPVVVVTALTDAKARQAAIEAGADDFLSKPIDALELQIRVKALLAVKRIYDELEAARRKAEEQDRLKTEFLASVSHELRTPLTAIASAAKILVKHGAEKKETLTRFAPMIVEQCDRLKRLLDEVLDLSKIEAGGVEWRDETFRGSLVADAVVAMFQGMAEEKGIKLTVAHRPSGPTEGFLRGDRDRLMQVLVNLVNNAIKFTPEGGQIRVSSARSTPEEASRWLPETARPGQGAVLFAVEDTGVGIAPEHQALVFDRFRQVVDPSTGKPQGTGLGLAICREIVTRHGGRVGLRSALGQGSRFTVALPEAAAPAGNP